MIQQVAAYQVGQQVFPTIEAAQIQEIRALLQANPTHDSEVIEEYANFIVEHTDAIVAILTCQPRTKKPRSDKGKKRSPKTDPEK